MPMKMSEHFPVLSIAAKRIYGAACRCKEYQSNSGTTLTAEQYDEAKSIVEAAGYAVRHHDSLVEQVENSASVAAIEFALVADCGMEFLKCWNEGDFTAIRDEWPEAPKEVFIGADPLFSHKNTHDQIV